MMAVVTLVLGGVAAFAPNANARSIGGWAGHPVPEVQGTQGSWACFQENAGSVQALPRLGCGPTAAWEVSLFVDSSPFNPAFTGTPGVSCTSNVTFELGGIAASSPFATESGPFVLPLHPGSLNVPFGGGAYLYCNMPSNNSFLYSVLWP
jgi:hypothetical protein